ncbi:11473_t:CDS:2 [Acaulospora morrowiae]|uniref:11473_t:CDS:1 n=1 Tax=Acaulospora morrowiae TaxID=94023 RepID=A0A9N9B5M3_9GLOM|nr:11473_t:CDS:2 [Acaulospora morrowiae]
MRGNCFFYDCEDRIVGNENEVKLYEIIRENAIRIVRLSKPDWSNFIETCEYGFQIAKEGPIRASKKAMTIDDYKIGNENTREETIHHISHLEHLCELNLVSNSKDIILPWLPIYLKLTKKNLEEFSEISSNTYNVSEHPMTCIKLSKSNIGISPELNQEIKEAVEDMHPVEKLIEITKKYGQFYAKKIVFGGKIIEQKNIPDVSRKNLSKKNSNIIPTSNEYRTIIGGNKGISRKNEYEWLKSLEHDPETWEIIGYQKIASIFNLLPEKNMEQKILKQKVLKALGQRILQTKVEKLVFDFEPMQTKPYVHPLNMGFNPNVEEHQIFPTILNNKEGDIFGLRVDYLDDKSPAIVLHRTQKKKKKRKYELEICCVVTGYLNDFKIKDFNPDIDIESHRVEVNTHKNSYFARIVKDLDYSKSILGTCVIERGANSTYVSHESTIITGIHFREQVNSCVFVYDLESCTRYNIAQNLFPLNDLYIHYW